MAGNITVSGGEDISRRMEELGKKARKAIRSAVDAGAAIIQSDAEKRAPRATSRQRSRASLPHLSDNIALKPARTKRDGTVAASVYVKTGPGGVYHANPVEYGHIVRTKNGYKRVAAKPFMGPARESNKQAVKDKIADVLRGALF